MYLHQEDQWLMNSGLLEPALWFHDNDPNAVIALHNPFAFNGTNIRAFNWKYMYADLSYWCPDCEIKTINTSDLILFEMPPHNKGVDYVFTPCMIFPEYVKRIASFDLPFPEETMIWHIYKTI